MPQTDACKTAHLILCVISTLVSCSGHDFAGDDAGAFPCRPGVMTVGTGHHNPGLDCRGVCHDHGFTVAGTLYTTANGAAPVTGATITIIDAAEHTIDVVTQQNGNFFTSATISYPITLVASNCPAVAKMPSPLLRTDVQMGGCNQNSCHVVTAVGHVHLP
jgi:hypothetical protein